MKSAEWLIAGEQFYGGGTRNIPGEPGRKFLRAIELETGKVAWSRPMEGPATSWGGVVSTASGLLFYCDDSGAFAAADAWQSRIIRRITIGLVLATVGKRLPYLTPPAGL